MSEGIFWFQNNGVRTHPMQERVVLNIFETKTQKKDSWRFLVFVPHHTTLWLVETGFEKVYTNLHTLDSLWIVCWLVSEGTLFRFRAVWLRSLASTTQQSTTLLPDIAPLIVPSPLAPWSGRPFNPWYSAAHTGDIFQWVPRLAVPGGGSQYCHLDKFII